MNDWSTSISLAGILVGILCWQWGRHSARGEFVCKAECKAQHAEESVKHTAILARLDRLTDEMAAGNEIFLVLLQESPSIDKQRMGELIAQRKRGA